VEPGWAAGVDLRWHTTGFCYAPDKENLHYETAEEAFEDRLRQSMVRLDKAAYFAQDQAGKKSALALLDALRGSYQEEIITNGLDRA